MNSSSNTEIRRCRPLLGTFVEIAASGLKDDALQDAVNDAFDSIERIQNLLSIHDSDSELSRLNREALLRPVQVSGVTFTVLRRAHQLAAESGGAFDPTVAPILARWGLLPPGLRRKRGSTWRDVLLLSECNVRFLLPLALDLGGIAKGFAVDVAIKTLKRNGVKSATVNAGGDLRVFGGRPSTIHLRHPERPQLLTEQTIQLHDCAMATSSPCFTRKRWRGQAVSHLVDPKTGSAITGATSVSVCAPECWLADALTKVVFMSPRKARKLLAKYDAVAFVLSA